MDYEDWLEREGIRKIESHRCANTIKYLYEENEKLKKKTDNRFDVYVAGAYSAPEHLGNHEKARIHAARFDALTYYAGALMREGLTVLSPISHSHPIALAHPNMSTYTEFWIRQDKPALLNSRFMHVLEGPGVRESLGVAREIEIAKEHEIEIWRVVLNGMDCTGCGQRADKYMLSHLKAKRDAAIRYCPACWTAIVARGDRSE